MLPLRPAAVLARSVASLDLLSGGRGRAGPAFVLGPSGDIVSAIGTFAELVAPVVPGARRGRTGRALGRPGVGGCRGSSGSCSQRRPSKGVGAPVILSESESESESAADAARPLERDGSWGNAGGLPVTDRPRARPSSAADQPGRVGIPAGRDNHRNLVAIHDHLRSELEQIRLAVSQVADGELDPGGARTLIARMTLRQNHWTLGSFCASYCRIVTIHHTVEDAHLFPNLDGGTLAGAGVATAGRRTRGDRRGARPVRSTARWSTWCTRNRAGSCRPGRAPPRSANWPTNSVDCCSPTWRTRRTSWLAAWPGCRARSGSGPPKVRHSTGRVSPRPRLSVRHDRCGLPGVRTGQLLDASAERRHRIPASMKASMSPSNTAPGLPTS